MDIQCWRRLLVLCALGLPGGEGPVGEGGVGEGGPPADSPPPAPLRVGPRSGRATAVVGTVILSFSLVLSHAIVALAPFGAMLGALAGLWAAAAALTAVGVASLVAPAAWAVLPALRPHLPIDALNPPFLVLAGIGLAALGLLAFIGLGRLSRWLCCLVVRYVRFAVRLAGLRQEPRRAVAPPAGLPRPPRPLGRGRLWRLALITAIVAASGLSLGAAVGVLWGPLAWARAPRGARIAAGVLDERQSTAVAGLERLVVETVNEDVRVRVAQSAQGAQLTLRLRGTYRPASGRSGAENAPRLVLRREGGLATARVEHPSWLGALWPGADRVLEVQLPVEFRGVLSARSVSGDVELGDLVLAGVGLATTSGDLRAGRLVTGQLSLATVSGQITVRAALARATDVTSTSGSVRVEGLSGSLRGESVSGELHFRFAVAPGPVQLQNVSGGVSLQVPPGANLRLEARSGSGQVTCRLPLQLEEYSGGGGRGELAGLVGRGGDRISVQTDSGNILIED